MEISLDTSDGEDDSKIEKNENNKISSSSTTLSSSSSCDATKPENTVPNLQDTPFKMISIEVNHVLLEQTIFYSLHKVMLRKPRKKRLFRQGQKQC